MPGVVISTAVRTGPSSATVRESSQAFFVGLAERGPVDSATLVQSIAEFESFYGGYVAYSYLHPTVETFFEEGGTQCYIARVAGGSASSGTKVLNDSDDDPVLTLTANGPGAWSADVDITVTNPTASTFIITVSYEDDVVYSTGTVTSAAQAAGRINLSSVASRYISAAVTAGATTIPEPMSASLSTGTDDLAGVDDSVLIEGLDLFNDAFGTGAVSIPDGETAGRVAGASPYTDYDGTTKASPVISNALIAHANTYNRVAIIHAGIDDTTTEAAAKSLTLSAEDGSEHGAMYYPYVDVPTSTAGVVRRIPPDGYVAAKRALAHNQSGAHIPAAGLISAGRFVSGVASDINKATGDALDSGNINAIRIIQNSVRIYGARALSFDDENFRFITTQEIVNHVVVESQRSLEDLVFGVIDGRDTIFSAITSRLIAILAPMREQGALFQAFDANGKKVDNGYTVRCDAALNPVTQLAGGTVKAKVGVRTSSVGDKIEVDIIKSNLTASVV